MKFDSIDRLILLALVLTFIGDGLALLAEVLSQRLDRQQESESENEKKALIAQLTELERRISKLEKT